MSTIGTVARAAPDTRRRAVNPHAALAILLSVLAVAATWPIWVQVARDAIRDEERSNSLLAIPVAAWLVWLRRQRFAGLALRWGMAGPLIMGAGWAIAALGFRMGIEVALNLGGLLIVLGASYTALGPGVFVRFLPAVGALVLVLPVPGRVRLAVAGPLQEWSARISQVGLDLLGITVLRSGNVLTINGVEVGIAEACNGMRMVAALAVIAYAFAFSTRLRPSVRASVLLASPLIALTVNVLRLIPTVIIYGNADSRTAEAFHDASGWGCLAVAIALLLGMTSLLRWLEVPIDARPRARSPRDIPTPHRFGIAAPAIAGLLLASVFAIGGIDARRPAGAEAYHARVAAAIHDVPYRLGDAVGLDQQVSPGAIRILRPNAILERRYMVPSTGAAFGLTIVHCGDARDLLDHYPPRCYPSNGWTAAGMRGMAFEVGDLTVPTRLYDFTRRSERGVAGARVLSFFVLPAGRRGVVDDMEAVAAASRSAAVTGLGAAHIMLSFSREVDDQTVRHIVESVLEQLEPVIRTVEGGVPGA